MRQFIQTDTRHELAARIDEILLRHLNVQIRRMRVVVEVVRDRQLLLLLLLLGRALMLTFRGCVGAA